MYIQKLRSKMSTANTMRLPLHYAQHITDHWCLDSCHGSAQYLDDISRIKPASNQPSSSSQYAALSALPVRQNEPNLAFCQTLLCAIKTHVAWRYWHHTLWVTWLSRKPGGLQKISAGTSVGYKSACCNCTLDIPKRFRLSSAPQAHAGLNQ